MLNINKKTMPPPSELSGDWYRDFYNSFSMSQLMRTMLDLSFNSMALVHANWKEEDEKKEGKNVVVLNKYKKIILGSEILMRSSLEYLEDSNNKLLFYMKAALLQASGGGIEESFPIDDVKLFSMAKNSDWSEIVSGFLNLWELLFLVGNFESVLKSKFSLPRNGTPGLMGAIFNRNKNFITSCKRTIGVNKDFCIKFWDLIVAIRNLYAHQHGVLDVINIEVIKTKSDKFSSLMVNFVDSNMAARILASDEDVKNAFLIEPRVCGDFYLLNNYEMNIIRNFLSQFTSALNVFCMQNKI